MGVQQNNCHILGKWLQLTGLVRSANFSLPLNKATCREVAMPKLDSNPKTPKRLCSVDGCERVLLARGLCSTHYMRLHTTGAVDANRPIGQHVLTPEERFWTHVDKSNTNGCWIWTGCLSKNGYGYFTSQGQTLAHRASWQIHYGDIPKDSFVCHKCDNPSCIRPDHLFLGTHQDNTADMVAKNRQASGMKNGHAKLKEGQVLEIRRLYATGKFSLSKLGIMYSISSGTIWLIIKRLRWKHL